MLHHINQMLGKHMNFHREAKKVFAMSYKRVLGASTPLYPEFLQPPKEGA